MKTETVKAIFTNLLFVIGVILIIFGFVRGALITVNMVTFDKYPLDYYQETQCDLEYLRPPMPEGENALTESDEDLQERRQRCLDALEYERQVRQTEDIVTAISTLVAGGALVFFFKRFIFSK